MWFRRRSPRQLWNESPSRLGWSVLDARLVVARGNRRGKRLQLRFTDDGSFMFPLGILPKGAAQLLDSGLWIVAPETVDEVSGGTRVATTISETFGYMLHNRHAEVILYRIAHGMLYPDDELVETLGIVPTLNEGENRIDILRARTALQPDRVSTVEEFAETHAEFVRREVEVARIMAVLGSEESTEEMINTAMASLDEHVDSNPFTLDGAPYLKDES